MSPTELVDLTRSLLQSLDSRLVDGFVALWPEGTVSRTAESTQLPVLRWLEPVGRQAPAFSASLIEALRRAAPALHWAQTYRASEAEAHFLRNYGWTELFGKIGPGVSRRLACGFLLLGPAVLYPRHVHEAEELYIPLSGVADWEQGDEVWREQIPGAVIHHEPREPHAIRTRAQPLLALYLWRGTDLGQKAKLC